MKLIIEGHERYSAVEQALLNFFPSKPPGEAVSSLRSDEHWIIASARISVGGFETTGFARIPADSSEIDYCLKEAFYQAAIKLPHVNAPWGSLTGIRPAKLAARIISSGLDPRTVLSEKYHVVPERQNLAIECAETALKIKETLSPDEFSLYVGIPFCPTRCDYCSFVSNGVEKSGDLLQPYTERLCEEISAAGEMTRRIGKRPSAIYWGGGTPTSLSKEQLMRIGLAIKRSFDLSGVREYTVEAGRPDTITMEKLEAILDLGAKRISVNPQTLHDSVLLSIGRRHTAAQARDAYASVRKAGFECVNTDIIAGLPGDTGFDRTLDEVLQWAPESITIHTLSIKKGARLGEAGFPGGLHVGDMLVYANNSLRNLAYHPYYLYRQKFMAGGFENVGWCKPGFESLYNVCMMEELHTVLSVGAGGVSKLVRGDRIERVFHCKFPLEYLQKYDKMMDGIITAEYFMSEKEGIYDD